MQLLTSSQKEQQSLIKICSIKDKNQYIVFRSTVSKQLLTLLSNQDLQLRQKWFKIIFLQISTSSDLRQRYLAQDQEKLLSTLSSIVQFTGQNLDGIRYPQDCEDQQKPIIRLKLIHIENIKFTNLKYLVFNCCFLNNIQALAWLDIRNVKQIWFYQNNILSLKPFSKTYFQQLTEISLIKNPFTYNSYHHFQRLYSPKLKNIYLNESLKQVYSIHLQDLRPFTKIKIDEQRWNVKQKLEIFCDPSSNNISKPKWKQIINMNSLLQLSQF